MSVSSSCYVLHLKDFARDTLGAEWEEGVRELLFKLLWGLAEFVQHVQASVSGARTSGMQLERHFW